MSKITGHDGLPFYRIDPEKEEHKIGDVIMDEFSSIIMSQDVYGTIIRIDRSPIPKETRYLIELSDGSTRSRTHHWLGKILELPDLIFKEMLLK